jgi:hypothetical protein
MPAIEAHTPSAEAVLGIVAIDDHIQKASDDGAENKEDYE